MSNLLGWGCAAIAVVMTIQPVVMALPATEVSRIAQKITVLIDGQNPGSGVLVHRQGNTYYVLTAQHVVATPDEYDILTADGQKYRLDYRKVKKFGNVDLALVEFTSDRTYETAQIGDSQRAVPGATVYVAGFPNPGREIRERIFQFRSGEISARPAQPLADGYALVYTNSTREGFSGGPVLDENGLLVGIHGRAEVDASQPLPANQGGNSVPSRVGINLGIPINTFLTLAKSLGLTFTVAVAGTVRVTPQGAVDVQVQPVAPVAVPRTVEELAVLAKPKIDQNDFDSALNLYNQFIKVNPQTWPAYVTRGFIYRALKRPQDAFNDFNLVIKNVPQAVRAYIGRGTVRLLDLKDLQGAFEDFSQALKNKPSPELEAWAYDLRGNTLVQAGRYQEALLDLRKAAELYRSQGNQYAFENTTQFIRETEWMSQRFNR